MPALGRSRSAVVLCLDCGEICSRVIFRVRFRRQRTALALPPVQLLLRHLTRVCITGFIRSTVRRYIHTQTVGSPPSAGQESNYENAGKLPRSLAGGLRAAISSTVSARISWSRALSSYKELVQPNVTAVGRVLQPQLSKILPALRTSLWALSRRPSIASSLVDCWLLAR